MNRNNYYILSLILLITWLNSPAQNVKNISLFKPANDHYSSRQFKLLPHSFAINKSPLLNNRLHVLKPFDNNIQYDAFFCKMEVNNAERFNIRIKIHAGNYDDYTRVNNIH